MEKHEESSRIDDIDEQLARSQQKTWKAVQAIAEAIRPGMRESEAIKYAQKLLMDMGSRKFWHKCHIRFGSSTTLSFNDPYVDTVLNDDDIFYIDIGPIWDGIEGDAGTTFVTGSNPEMARCRADAVAVFAAVKTQWQQHRTTGIDLYKFAQLQATERGWLLAPSYVRGHRLSEFPHSFYSKLHIDELNFCPAPKRWVLEIHICDPQMRFGAFYEDLL